MELVALAALGTAATFLGLSDWKRRSVDLRWILVCYGIAACINGAVVLADLAVSSSPQAAYRSATEAMKQSTGSVLAVTFLSSIVVLLHRLGLLASGDALSIPAMLGVIMLVSQPIEIILYFASAMAIVLAFFVARNVRNNVRYRDRAGGPFLHRLHLVLFCYYGSGYTCRHAFKYARSTRHDYDNDPYYTGKEETWLVPGLPLLSGFAPAVPVLFII